MKDREKRQLCIAKISTVLDTKNPDSYLRYVKKETSEISTPTLEHISNVFIEGQTQDLERLIRRSLGTFKLYPPNTLVTAGVSVACLNDVNIPIERLK